MRKHNNKQKLSTEINITHGVLETKLGVIEYTSDDIFYFNDGLVGFPNNVRFTLTDVPGIAHNQRYGMLQSMDDSSLSFIVYYPILDKGQQDSVLTNVQKMMEDEKITKDEVGLAFLDITNQDKAGQANVEFVTDAPLVFLSKTKEAWQMLSVQ